MKQIPLYTPCSRCGGHGGLAERPAGPRRTICPSCGGEDFVPTQEGRAILGLLRAAWQDDLLPEG